MRPVRHMLILSTMLLSGLALAFTLRTVASPEGDAIAADHSLTSAINKADQSSVGELLDPEFAWTDRTGQTRSKAEILPALASLATESDANIKVIAAGQVVLIHGNHRILAQNASVRFIRVWVKRPKDGNFSSIRKPLRPKRIPKSAAASALQATACPSPVKIPARWSPTNRTPPPNRRWSPCGRRSSEPF